MKYKFYKKKPTYDYNEIWEGYAFHLPQSKSLEALQKRLQQINVETTLERNSKYGGWDLRITYIPDELIGKTEIV